MRKAFLKYHFIVLMLLMITSITSGQEMTPGVIEIRQEVADSVGAFYFYDSARNIISPHYYAVDTSLKLFHHYQSLQRNGRHYAPLGNTGLAYLALKPLQNNKIESQFGIHSYDAYRFKPDNLPYYILNVPFSVLAYTLGKDREQILKGRHYQQVRRNLGVGLHFNIYNSMGSYLRQKTDNVSLAFQTLYRTNNHRYGIAANFINNRFKHRENGGIANPEQFENNIESDRSRINIRLNNAENQWKESNTYFRQYFHLAKPLKSENDSAFRALNNPGTLIHTFNYQRLAQTYYDRNPGSGFYREILNDSIRTHDSLVLHTVTNRLQWHIPLMQSEFLKFDFNAGISHVFMHHLSHNTRDTTPSTVADYFMFRNISEKYNQLVPFINPEITIAKRLSLELWLQRITGDYRNKDYEVRGKATYKMGKTDPFIVKLDYLRKAESPGLFYKRYHSNHFIWEKDFDKQQISKLQATGSWRRTTAGVSLTTFNGYAYLDTLAHPAWHSQAFNVLSAFIDSRLQWRGLTVDNRITFYSVSDETVFRLPELIVNSVLSYELDLFQGALQAMGGVELFYNTAWQAPAYMPALRTFYLQNGKTTGNYLYADVFINFRIKRARLFLMMQHANQDLMGYHYYMIPYYPMPDRALKFGINWMFYD